MQHKQRNVTLRKREKYSAPSNNRANVSVHQNQKPSHGWGKTAGHSQAWFQPGRRKVGVRVDSPQVCENPKTSGVNVHPEKVSLQAPAPGPVGPMNWAAAVRGHPQPGPAPQRPAAPEPRTESPTPAPASSLDEAKPEVCEDVTAETADIKNVSPIDQHLDSDSGLQPETEPQQSENAEQNAVNHETSLLLQSQKEQIAKLTLSLEEAQKELGQYEKRRNKRCILTLHVKERDEEIARLKLEVELLKKESEEKRKSWEEQSLKKEMEAESKLHTQREEATNLQQSMDQFFLQGALGKDVQWGDEPEETESINQHLEEEVSSLKRSLDQGKQGLDQCLEDRERLLKREEELSLIVKWQQEELSNIRAALDRSKEQEIRVQDREVELKTILQNQRVEIFNLKHSLDQSVGELQQKNIHLKKDQLLMKKREEETHSLLQNQGKEITDLRHSLGEALHSLQAQEKQREAVKAALLKEKSQIEANLQKQQNEFSRQEAQAKEEAVHQKKDLERKLSLMEQHLTRTSGIETELKLVKEQLKSRTEQFNLLVADNANILKLVKITEDSHSYLLSQAQEKQCCLERALKEAENQLQTKQLEMEEERSDHRRTISTMKALLHQTEQALESVHTTLRQGQHEEKNVPLTEKEEVKDNMEKKREKKDKPAQKKKGLWRRIKKWVKAKTPGDKHISSAHTQHTPTEFCD